MTKYVNEIKLFLSGIALTYRIDLDIAYALTVLLFFDFIIGMIKYSMVDELTFSIEEAKKGFLKKGLVLLVVFTSAIAAKGLNLDFSLYVNSFMKLFIVNEFFSIVNNYRSIKSNKDIKTDDFIGIAIESAGNKMKSVIDKFFN
jgi:hypothetical protein